MRATAQCLATVWEAEKMLSGIQKTGYGKEDTEFKICLSNKTLNLLKSLNRNLQRKAVMIKTYKQHMKDWDFQTNHSHTIPFLLINPVRLSGTLTSFPGILCFPHLHRHESLSSVRLQSEVTTPHTSSISFIFQILLKTSTFY